MACDNRILMTDKFVPAAEGTCVAQAIARKPAKAPADLRRYGGDLYEHYQATGLYERDPPRAKVLIVKHMLRAVRRFYSRQRLAFATR